MSNKTTADPALIPDIEAFEERVAIMVYEGGVPSEQGLPNERGLSNELKSC